MKKILLASTALVGLAIVSAPAHAEIKTDIGGYFRGYGVYADNNEAAGAANSLRKFEFRRNNELHFNGETTTDMGLTVGAHSELEIADNTTGNIVNETYAYFSGGWGRFNFGSEDGAAYLLQVAAPSGDSNVDGMRNYIAGLNPKTNGTFATGIVAGNDNDLTGIVGLVNTQSLKYDHADFRNTDRLTFLTPKFNGFQAGVSYAPKVGQLGVNNGLAGMTADKTAGDTGAVWEGSARYDGEFQGFGFSAGAGYSDSQLEAKNTAPAAVTDVAIADDGIRTWNGGLNVSFSGFSLGGSYLRADTSNAAFNTAAVSMDVQQDTYVLGAGYDNGPYHAGVSYLNQQTERDASGATANDLAAYKQENDRWTVGGGYTFGPGMTFRGAVAWGQFDQKAADNGANVNAVGGSAAGIAEVAASKNNFTQVTLGTDIQF